MATIGRGMTSSGRRLCAGGRRLVAFGLVWLGRGEFAPLEALQLGSWHIDMGLDRTRGRGGPGGDDDRRTGRASRTSDDSQEPASDHGEHEEEAQPKEEAEEARGLYDRILNAQPPRETRGGPERKVTGPKGTNLWCYGCEEPVPRRDSFKCISKKCRKRLCSHCSYTYGLCPLCHGAEAKRQRREDRRKDRRRQGSSSVPRHEHPDDGRHEHRREPRDQEPLQLKRQLEEAGPDPRQGKSRHLRVSPEPDSAEHGDHVLDRPGPKARREDEPLAQEAPAEGVKGDEGQGNMLLEERVADWLLGVLEKKRGPGAERGR